MVRSDGAGILSTRESIAGDTLNLFARLTIKAPSKAAFMPRQF